MSLLGKRVRVIRDPESMTAVRIGRRYAGHPMIGLKGRIVSEADGYVSMLFDPIEDNPLTTGSWSLDRGDVRVIGRSGFAEWIRRHP